LTDPLVGLGVFQVGWDVHAWLLMDREMRR
jgi:hypothetical protein